MRARVGEVDGATAEAPRRLGVCVVGLGGAVATTAIAGIELLRAGAIGTDGLPLAALPSELTCELTQYENLVFGGWDLCPDDLARAAATHNVLTTHQLETVTPALERIKPFSAIGNQAFCRNIEGTNLVLSETHRDSIRTIRRDLSRFRAEQQLDSIVCINLASTERFVNLSAPLFASIENFEHGLDENVSEISPAMLYAYAAICDGTPYGNFTPSTAVDVPALIALAEREGVPLAGKDGKTGQTFIKTVIAPALRSRALHVDGWFSTNILGNRDGLALDDKDSLQSKISTKASVLDQILGYRVEDHLVDIRYYRPRGDNKEAWDNIDITGFLGQPMQIKINFLCKDSILAAPLVIEIARMLELAERRGERGVQEQLSVFFKLPMTRRFDGIPQHAFHRQEEMLLKWLAQTGAEAEAARDEAQNTIVRGERAMAMEAGD